MRAAPIEAPRGRLRLSPKGALLAIVVAALLLYVVVPVRTYLAQRGQLARLEQETQVLENQNRVLRNRVRQLHHPAYLEQLARECLGMIRPGEIGFVVVPEGGDPDPGNC